MAIESINHFTVQTCALEKSKAFYIDVLGFTKGYRFSLQFLGSWFIASDFKSFVNALSHHGIEFDLRRLDDTQIWQFFVMVPVTLRWRSISRQVNQCPKNKPVTD